MFIQSDSFASREIHHENMLCVAGCCGHDIAMKTHHIIFVMTLSSPAKTTQLSILVSQVDSASLGLHGWVFTYLTTLF